MNRIISAIAVPGVGLVAYRSIPILWIAHPLDAFIVGCAMFLLGLQYLNDAMTGRNDL
ncbi:hypothetical protein G6M02_07970 [Agrobacterium rhizogenes]|nr:hypothetical protein [Rhizobium rhizogenes]